MHILSSLFGVGIYVKRSENKKAQRQAAQKEQSILDYGDSYFMNEFLKKDDIYRILKEVFGKYADTLPQINWKGYALNILPKLVSF